ncbi:MAG: hypothetical protein KAS32_03075 [Candidatus Peribacteraceae bacterium]|nr:hypothetical protein [Candidatus Peribacteraceae bacterium]
MKIHLRVKTQLGMFEKITEVPYVPAKGSRVFEGTKMFEVSNVTLVLPENKTIVYFANTRIANEGQWKRNGWNHIKN